MQRIRKHQDLQLVIYLAPPAYRLLVEEDYSLALSLENRVNYLPPGMTGANADGTNGLMRIKECGGLTVVQAPETAEVDTMPESAIKSVEVDYIVPLDKLGDFLNKMVMGQ